jgi:hypothetical protein
MSNAKFLVSDDLEPLTVTIAETTRLTGESRSHQSRGRR